MRWQTQGKGTAQELHFLASPIGTRFGAVNVTSRQFYRLNGASIQIRGVKPDVQLQSPRAEDILTEAGRPNALPFDRIDPIFPHLVRPIDGNTLNQLRQRLRRHFKNGLHYPHTKDKDVTFAAALKVARYLIDSSGSLSIAQLLS